MHLMLIKHTHTCDAKVAQPFKQGAFMIAQQ